MPHDRETNPPSRLSAIMRHRRSERCACLISDETGHLLSGPRPKLMSQAAIYLSHWARLFHLSESPGIDHPC